MHEVVLQMDDKRIVYIVNEINLGVNPTINIGFKRAKGEFLCVLAADDVFPSGSLQSRIEVLENNSFDAVHAGTTIVQNETKRYMKPLDTTMSNNVIDFLTNGSETHGINNATFMYTRKVFAEIGYRDETDQYFPHNDYEFALRTLLHCNVGYVDYPAYIYELHPHSHSEIHAKNEIAEKKQRALKDKYIKHFSAKNKY